MDYLEQVDSLRKKREALINEYRLENHEGNQIFEYFPIDNKWKVPVVLIHRTPKGIIKDYKIGYQLVGKADFKLETLQIKADLYNKENETESYHLGLKDMTSGNSSYDTGRFVPIIKENDQYFADFNLAFTPVCGHFDPKDSETYIACPNFRDKIAMRIEAGEKASEH